MPTILVAEDEAPLRDLLCRLLQGRGYEVLAAGDGLEALRVACMHPGSIDLLVTDIRMPAMQGTELAQRLRRARPETKVLFISAYAEGRALAAPCLRKPFSPARLLQKVAEVLHAAAREQPERVHTLGR